MATKNGEKPIRIAIVGLGMAGTVMVPSILAHPEFELVGAVDPNEDLRGKFAKDFGCPTHSSMEELVQRDDVDAVYIATPHQMHREHTVLAADHGKHVIVEKPMALTLEDCDAMLASTRANDTILIIGHTHGFDAPIKKMKDIIDSGRLGALRMMVMFNYTDFLYRPRRAEELDTSLGGGILFNQVPHQIDVARTLTGTDVANLVAVTGQYDQTRPTEGAMMAMINFKDGVAATVTYGGYDHFDSDEFHGWIGEGGQKKAAAHGKTRATLNAVRASGGEEAMRANVYGYGGAMSQRMSEMPPTEDYPHFGTLIVSCEKGDLRHVPEGIAVYTDEGCEIIPMPAPRTGGGRSEVLDELSGALLRNEPPVHDGEFGRGTLETCLAIIQSASDGKQVFLP